MASGWYNKALGALMSGDLAFDTDTIKLLLVSTKLGGYTYDPDHDFVDRGTNDAADPSYTECAATNYVRKTVTPSVEVQNGNNRAVVKITDLTWTALGGVANETIAGAILYKHSGSDDTANMLIAFLDLTDTPTNGGDITLDFDGTNGNLRLTA